MNQKKKIKVNFCDWWPRFNPKNNKIYKTLSQHYEVEISEQPDFLFYSCFGAKYQKYENCVKIFLTDENVLPNFNDCDYAEAFDFIDFGDRYIRKISSVSRPKDINITEDLFNRRFCNFIYSNATSGEGTHLRQEFCHKLMEYKHIDCPGKVLNNMNAEDELSPRNGDWVQSKLEFLKKYKFTIAFENSCSNGYTTEKLSHPLQSLSIPIYWGNPLVIRDFNPKAFINCNDYDNDFDAVIERVKELDNDPDKYLAMLRENPMQPDFVKKRDFKEWLVNIIEKGNKPFNKDPRDYANKPLRWELTCLRNENKKLQEQITALSQNKESKPASKAKSTEKKVKSSVMVKPFKKVSGNWFYKKVETERYIKTYICGICTRKRSANMCQYIDLGLQELERRLKTSIVDAIGGIK